MRTVAVVALACLAAACNGPDTGPDAQAKQTLQGRWYYEYRDPYERPMRAVVTFDAKGTFSTVERAEGAPRDESSAGPWYVTEGLLKMQVGVIDGKKLGTRAMLFFTCRLVDLTTRAFGCEQDGGKRRVDFQRVADDFVLP